MPREYCQKNSLDNLSKLQFQLQTLQLQKVSDNLFRANKYVSPDESKTWNYLLNKNKHLHNGSDTPPDDPDHSTPSTNNISTHDNPNQDLVPESESLVQPALDVYGQIEDQIVQTPHKFLRSGRAYSTLSSELQHPRPILKINSEDHSEPELVFSKPQTDAHVRASRIAKSEH